MQIADNDGHEEEKYNVNERSDSGYAMQRLTPPQASVSPAKQDKHRFSSLVHRLGRLPSDQPTNL